MLGAGADTNDERRIKDNMLGADNPLAPLYALRKDHKLCQDEEQGPPVRPVCGAAACYNNKLSHLISMILTEVWKSKENSSICTSTEGMIAEMKLVNKEQEGCNHIVGSADVKALYPALTLTSP